MTLVSASALFLLYTHEEKQAHPSLAASAAAASGASQEKEVKTRGHHTPIYDINIESKNFPKQVPVFIEVSKVGLCVLVEMGGRWMGGWKLVEI